MHRFALQQHHFVLILLLLAAIAFTWWSLSTVPQNIALHLNGRWHILLMSETDPDQVHLQKNYFTIDQRKSGELYLRGYGTIQWRTHTLQVNKGGVYFNDKLISVTHPNMSVTVLFYPDGRVEKGQTQILPNPARSKQHD